jgi:hypothetical protein
VAGYGYSYVSETGFIAFQHDIEDGVWENVSIAEYDSPERALTAAALGAPHPVYWKLRIAWALAELMEAVGASAADRLDLEWDAAQRRLHHRIAAAVDDKDPDVRAAAERLQSTLLVGGGTGQTGYEFHGEVDFGRKQLLLTKDGQAAADVEKLKLADALHDIDEATEALAKAIGRSAGQKRAAPPSIRLRDAMIACRIAFNAVHEQIAWFVDHTANGPDRDRLVALQAPFDALLARNPPPAPKPVPTTDSGSPPDKPA